MCPSMTNWQVGKAKLIMQFAVLKIGRDSSFNGPCAQRDRDYWTIEHQT